MATSWGFQVRFSRVFDTLEQHLIFEGLYEPCTIFYYHVDKPQVTLMSLLSDGTQRPPVDNITSPIGTSSWPPFFTASHHFVVWDLVKN